MPDVDWDKVAEDASDSPRAVLAEVLSRADTIKGVIVLFYSEDGTQELYASAGISEVTMLAMLEYNKWRVCQRIWSPK